MSSFTDLLACPVPQPPGDRILLAHGEGARMSRRLIRDVLMPAFDNEFLHPLGDAAVLPEVAGPLVMTTDSFVVTPLFFPGGDIGRLAVHGTVNDLAVSGALPLFLSLALILEEGLPMATLRQVIEGIRAATAGCGVRIVTGDTKVVPRGAADQLFINTTGIGRKRPGLDLGPHRIRPGDRVLVSGTIGDHGLAILSAREGLLLESGPSSDTAPLHELVGALLACGAEVHFLRDATRGGVSAVLHEVHEAAGVSIMLDESALPLTESVRGACEILGLDPLYVANEGKLIAIVAAESAHKALTCLRQHPLGLAAAIIGEVTPASPHPVVVRSLLGTLRVLDEPTGAPLPRIC